MAPLLPKLRGQFAEFLKHGSLARLSIFYPSTCVGLRYGRRSWLFSAAFNGTGIAIDPDRLTAASPVVATAGQEYYDACFPSATPLGLALGAA